MLPSKEVATPMKFFATKLCRSSPAQMGYMHIFTTKQTPAPSAMSKNRVTAVWINSPVRYPDTIMKQYVNKNTLNPYSYGFIVGYNFA